MSVIDIRTAKRFERLTRDMSIPQNRRIPNEANLRWFLRNALVKNQDHSNLQHALEIARQFS